MPQAGILTSTPPGKILVNTSLFNPNDTSQWEWIQGDDAPDEDTITPVNSVATMDGWFHNPDNDQELMLSMVAFFVGYSVVNYDTWTVPFPSTAPTKKQYPLSRSLPIYHPRWPFMRCTGVSVKGKMQNLTTPSYANFAGRFDTTIKLPIPNYQKYRVQLRFEQPMYNVYPDGLTGPSGLPNEWDRFVDPPTTSDEGEIITVDGGQYIYLYPTSGATSNPVVLNGPSIKVYAQRQGLMVKAHNIASDFLMNQYGIMPKFLAAKGHVNSTTFLGQAGGTMLLQHYKPVLTAQPVATGVLDSLLFGIDVDMHFSFTDPKRAEAGESRRGWQLYPKVFADGWYGIAPKSNTSGNLYPRFDMNELLRYWDNGYLDCRALDPIACPD